MELSREEVADTIERVRSERFLDVDRDLVLEILRLHADGLVADLASTHPGLEVEIHEGGQTGYALFLGAE